MQFIVQPLLPFCHQIETNHIVQEKKKFEICYFLSHKPKMDQQVYMQNFKYPGSSLHWT